MTLDVFQSVACSHRHGSTCVAASDATGVQIRVTNPVCNVTCPKHDGPRGGGPLPDDGGEWAHAMLQYAWGNPLRKVAEQYAKPFDVRVPDDQLLAAIRDAFAPVLAEPWADGLGLTGSILSKRADHKDYDVVLFVRDLRGYLDARPTLPTQVNGVRVDTFATTRRAQWFLVLDLADLKLYRSGVYNLASVDPRVTIVEVPDAYAAFRTPIATEPPPPPSPAPRRPHAPATRVATDWRPGQAQAMWADLHTSREADPAWLSGFISRIPCGTCKGHFRQFVAANPPPFADEAAWFAWTVSAHNAVNVRRGVPTWTQAQAEAAWRPSQGGGSTGV